MEALTESLAQLLATVLFAILSGAVAYLTSHIKRGLDSKRYKDIKEAFERDHAVVYEAVVNFVKAAEQMAFSELHGLTKDERYEYVRTRVLDFVEEASRNSGFPLKIQPEQIDAMIERAVLEMKREYEKGLGRG